VPKTVTVSIDRAATTTIGCRDDTSQGYIKSKYGNNTFSLTTGIHIMKIYHTDVPGNGVRNMFLENNKFARI